MTTLLLMCLSLPVNSLSVKYLRGKDDNGMAILSKNHIDKNLSKE